jgi:hypothetical protein
MTRSPERPNINVQVVSVADEGMAPSLQFLVDFVQQYVGQQRRQGSLNAKDNFRFERAIVGWRGQCVVDLRRKR